MGTDWRHPGFILDDPFKKWRLSALGPILRRYLSDCNGSNVRGFKKSVSVPACRVSRPARRTQAPTDAATAKVRIPWQVRCRCRAGQAQVPRLLLQGLQDVLDVWRTARNYLKKQETQPHSVNERVRRPARMGVPAAAG
jgi:hypothetical protein